MHAPRRAPCRPITPRPLVGEGRVIIAADVTTQPPTNKQPAVVRCSRRLARTWARSVTRKKIKECLLADGGYWNPRRHRPPRPPESTVVVIPTSDPHNTQRKQRPRQGPEGADRDQQDPLAQRRRQTPLPPPCRACRTGLCSHQTHPLGSPASSAAEDTRPSARNGGVIAATHNLLKLFSYQPQTA